MTQNKATEFKISATGNYVPSAKITSSIDAANYAKQFYSDDISVYESAFIILLNQASKVIGWAKIAQGGLAATIVDVRIVAKYAIDSSLQAWCSCTTTPPAISAPPCLMTP